MGFIVFFMSFSRYKRLSVYLSLWLKILIGCRFQSEICVRVCMKIKDALSWPWKWKNMWAVPRNPNKGLIIFCPVRSSVSHVIIQTCSYTRLVYTTRIRTLIKLSFYCEISIDRDVINSPKASKTILHNKLTSYNISQWMKQATIDSLTPDLHSRSFSMSGRTCVCEKQFHSDFGRFDNFSTKNRNFFPTTYRL